MTLTARRRAMLATVYAAAGVAVAGWAVSGCRERSEAAVKDVVLVVSGDTAGWITPCGCTVNQSGGLPRRGMYLTGLREAHAVVYADVGGAPGGASAYEALKFRAILAGEMSMGLAAHNLGGPELALGAAVLRKIAVETGAPLVSANAMGADGKALAEGVRIVAAGARKVALIGVVSARYQTAEVQVGPAREAVLRALEGHKGEYDRVVVLAYLPEEELTALARDLPEADAVIGGPTGQSLPPARMGGGGLLSSATNKGKFVVEASLEPGGAARIVELSEKFGDAAEQVRNVEAYRKALGAADFAAGATELAPGAARLPKAAGSASCKSCHEAEYAQWSKTGHGGAWQSLVIRGAQVDPSCQVCHTTNYGAPGGFVSMAASADRVDVGCESCHGPSAAHVADTKVHTSFLAMAQCTTCHDAENSPTFAVETYWARIRHGRGVTTMKEGAR